jgi:hypothetical protein
MKGTPVLGHSCWMGPPGGVQVPKPCPVPSIAELAGAARYVQWQDLLSSAHSRCTWGWWDWVQMERLRAHVSLTCDDFHTSYYTLILIGAEWDGGLGRYASVLTPEIDLLGKYDFSTIINHDFIFLILWETIYFIFLTPQLCQVALYQIWWSLHRIFCIWEREEMVGTKNLKQKQNLW